MSKVIIVDDDSTNTTLMQMLLELEGFEATAHPDIDSANKAIGAHTEALIIDYHLARGANGVELLRDVRAGNTDAPTNAVVIISSGDYRREQEAIEAGANRFLFKPYPTQTLIDTLNELLAAKGTNG